MAVHPAQLAKRRAYKVVLLQFACAFVVALLSCWPKGLRFALFVVWGGVLCSLPGFYFTQRFFSAQGAHRAREAFYAMWRAEFGKWVLTSLLFYLSARFMNVNWPALLLGFLVSHLAYWLAPWVFKK